MNLSKQVFHIESSQSKSLIQSIYFSLIRSKIAPHLMIINRLVITNLRLMWLLIKNFKMLKNFSLLDFLFLKKITRFKDVVKFLFYNYPFPLFYESIRRLYLHSNESILELCTLKQNTSFTAL